MLTDSPSSSKRRKSKKRAIKNEKESDDEDRLSSLPDSLLNHILSLLGDTKQVVRTCTLSRRWEFVWTDLSEVALVEKCTDFAKRSQFVDWVVRMLAMCKNLNKFAIQLHYDKRFASNLKFLFYFAIKNEVKDITFDSRVDKSYELPQMLYSYSSLTNLSISSCVMAPRGIIEWGSLKTLSIDEVVLTNCLIEKILSGCPVLEVLSLSTCGLLCSNGFDGLDKLNIYSPNLTTLDIKVLWCFTRDDLVLDITAPYLRVLSILNQASSVKFRLRNVQSVVQACFDFYYLEGKWGEYDMKDILESLQSIENLELGPDCNEMVTFLEFENVELPTFTKLQCLTLNVLKHERSIFAILGMLRSSPNLEELHVKNSWFSCKLTEEDVDEHEMYLEDCNMDLVAYHLKTVKISGFTEEELSAEHMMTVVQILLKSSNILEKMIISVEKEYASSSSTSTGYAEIVKLMLSFPRASPKAIVMLS